MVLDTALCTYWNLSSFQSVYKSFLCHCHLKDYEMRLNIFCRTTSEEPESLFWVTLPTGVSNTRSVMENNACCMTFCSQTGTVNHFFVWLAKWIVTFFGFCLVSLCQAPHGLRCEWGLTLGQDNYGPRHWSPIWMDTIK